MPYFEVTLDDDFHTVLGSDDSEILTFGVISTYGSPSAYLQVTSLNKVVGENEDLLRHHLQRGEHLKVAFQRDRDVLLKNTSGPPAIGCAACVDNSDECTGRVGFAVNLERMGLISASVDDDAMLHVSATWIRVTNQCLLEIACIRMTDRGQNQMLFKTEIAPGQSFGIKIT